jgi:hypothetical protein
MSNELHQFGGPDLKAAVHQLRGGHRARPDLRDRVVRRLTERRLQGTGAPEPRPVVRPPATPARVPWPGLRWPAVATAMLLIAGALGYWHFQRAHVANTQQARRTALLGAMAAIHDMGRGTASGLQPLSARLDNPAAQAAEASGVLGRAIPVFDLAARGWTLDAADFCTLGTARSVRFHFTRGSRSISVFSVAIADYGKIDGGPCEFVVGGHPIAGHYRDGSLNCIVGGSVCEMRDAIALRDAIRDH